MSTRSPFPYRSPALLGNGQQRRSPVPLPIRGNGIGNADGCTDHIKAFPTGNTGQACRLCGQPLLIPIPGRDICEMCRVERRPA